MGEEAICCLHASRSDARKDAPPSPLSLSLSLPLSIRPFHQRAKEFMPFL